MKKISVALIFALFGLNTVAMADTYICIGTWATCMESGKESVIVQNPQEACDKLYRKAAADLVYNVSCAPMDSNGKVGEFILVATRCD